MQQFWKFALKVSIKDFMWCLTYVAKVYSISVFYSINHQQIPNSKSNLELIKTNELIYVIVTTFTIPFEISMLLSEIIWMFTFQVQFHRILRPAYQLVLWNRTFSNLFKTSWRIKVTSKMRKPPIPHFPVFIVKGRNTISKILSN